MHNTQNQMCTSYLRPTQHKRHVCQPSLGMHERADTKRHTAANDMTVKTCQNPCSSVPLAAGQQDHPKLTNQHKTGGWSTLWCTHLHIQRGQTPTNNSFKGRSSHVDAVAFDALCLLQATTPNHCTVHKFEHLLGTQQQHRGTDSLKE